MFYVLKDNSRTHNNLSIQTALNALAIDNPMEYARLALDKEMQAWGMRKIVWKCDNFTGGLLCNGSPPFIKSSEKYKWDVRAMRGTIGSEI